MTDNNVFEPLTLETYAKSPDEIDAAKRQIEHDERRSIIAQAVKSAQEGDIDSSLLMLETLVSLLEHEIEKSEKRNGDLASTAIAALKRAQPSPPVPN